MDEPKIWLDEGTLLLLGKINVIFNTLDHHVFGIFHGLTGLRDSGDYNTAELLFSQLKTKRQVCDTIIKLAKIRAVPEEKLAVLKTVLEVDYKKVCDLRNEFFHRIYIKDLNDGKIKMLKPPGSTATNKQEELTFNSTELKELYQKIVKTYHRLMI